MVDFRVALTFDAEHPSRPHCPPGNHANILEILKRGGVRASFFLQGRWVTAYPSDAREVARLGHLVGNHSYSHSRLPRFNDAGLRSDVLEAEQCIADAVGVNPRPWFRCPNADGADDPRVRSILQSLGYQHVHSHIDSYDWQPNQTAGGVEANVVAGAHAHGDGAVVMMHNWPAPTTAALPQILARLKAAGASFVTVGELA